jgi:hypothetical protein
MMNPKKMRMFNTSRARDCVSETVGNSEGFLYTWARNTSVAMLKNRKIRDKTVTKIAHHELSTIRFAREGRRCVTTGAATTAMSSPDSSIMSTVSDISDMFVLLFSFRRIQ